MVRGLETSEVNKSELDDQFFTTIGQREPVNRQSDLNLKVQDISSIMGTSEMAETMPNFVPNQGRASKENKNERAVNR